MPYPFLYYLGMNKIKMPSIIMYNARLRYKFIVYNLLYKLSACSYKYYLTVNRRAAIVVARYIKRIRDDVTRDLRRRRTNDGRACPFYAGQPTQSNDRHTLVGAARLPAEKSKPVLLPVTVHMGIQFNNNNMCPIVL